MVVDDDEGRWSSKRMSGLIVYSTTDVNCVQWQQADLYYIFPDSWQGELAIVGAGQKGNFA